MTIQVSKIANEPQSVPVAVDDELDTLGFLDYSCDEIELPEGNDKEWIAFIQSIMGGEGNYEEEVLFYMDEDDFHSLHRRAWRVKNCGQYWQWLLTACAVPKKIPSVCGVWRTCQNCAKVRANKYLARIYTALGALADEGEPQALYVHHLSKKDARSLRQRLNLEDYLCLPQEDDTDLIITIDPKQGGDLLSKKELLSEDWTALTRTPEKRRVSGRLGYVPQEDEDKNARLHTQSVIIKAIDIDEKGRPEHEHIVEAFENAVDQAWRGYDKGPQTKWALQDFLFSLALNWCKSIERIGKREDRQYKANFHEINLRVTEEEITRIDINPIRLKEKFREMEVPLEPDEVPF